MSSVAGSTLNPSPGRIVLTTIRPMTSASVETTSKIDEALHADAADLLQVSRARDAEHHGEEDDRSDEHPARAR